MCIRDSQEILPLKDELSRMLPLWQSLRIPTVVIQGGKDTLVPPGNADFLKARLSKAEMILVPEMNHFVPWARDVYKRQFLSCRSS